jgi:hypothetical protein
MKTASYEGRQVFIALDLLRELSAASCICDGVVVSGTSTHWDIHPHSSISFHLAKIDRTL